MKQLGNNLADFHEIQYYGILQSLAKQSQCTLNPTFKEQLCTKTYIRFCASLAKHLSEEKLFEKTFWK
jgi:hypothetical protein